MPQQLVVDQAPPAPLAALPGGQSTAARDGEDKADLPYTQRPMVSWFQPLEIVRTAVRVMLAGVIARYIDRREAQAGLPRVKASDTTVQVDVSKNGADGSNKAADRCKLLVEHDFSDCTEVWIDYVADVGDGWDATYTTAMFVGQQKLQVDGVGHTLPRAQLLVFGGDCVYPTPSREAYSERLQRPFEAALPELPEARRPWLFAIPGNHDWYDGLTSFMRVFCQGRSIGAWRTKQSRSYFSVNLPAKWMIWGCDIQLDTRIDTVQLAHFNEVAKGFQGSSIILCTAKPSWIREMHRDAGAYKNYWYFRDQIKRSGCEVDVSIAGDLHHYIRYASSSGDNHKITAGGGGSFLRGTHDLPDSVAPPRRDEDVTQVKGEKEVCHESGFAFPSRIESRRLSVGALRFPFLRRNWAFCVLLGAVYLMLTWSLGLLKPSAGMSVLQSAVAAGHSLTGGLQGLMEYGTRLWFVAVVRPSVAVLPLGVILLFGTFCSAANPRARKLVRWLWGLAHGAVHVSFAVLITSLVTKVAASQYGADVLTWAPLEMTSVYAAIVVVGAIVGGLLMGLYLVLSDGLLTLHTNEAYSCQASPDYRCFLRMHIERDTGKLTIYPIGIRRAPRNWRRKLDRNPGDAYFAPHGEIPRVHLIEGPIVVTQDPR